MPPRRTGDGENASEQAFCRPQAIGRKPSAQGRRRTPAGGLTLRLTQRSAKRFDSPRPGISAGGRRSLGPKRARDPRSRATAVHSPRSAAERGNPPMRRNPLSVVLTTLATVAATSVPIVAMTAAVTAAPAASAATATQPYTWQNVKIGGGGFIDGIEFSPAQIGRAHV